MTEVTDTHIESGNLEPFKFSGNIVAAEAVTKGYWKGMDESGYHNFKDEERILNRVGIKESLRKRAQVLESSQAQHETVNLPPTQELSKKAQQLTAAFIESTQLEGWLPEEALKLVARFTRPDEIYVYSDEKIGHGGGLNLDRRYNTDEFPQDSDRPSITIAESIIRYETQSYLKIAKEVGLEMTPEQAIEIALGFIAVHEWSHSLERGLETKYSGILKSLPEYNDEKDYWMVMGLRNEFVYEQAKQVSLPLISGLKQIDASGAHIEQFATGFQDEAVKFVAKRQGFTEEQAQKFVGVVNQERKERLDDFIKVRDLLRATGLDDFSIWKLFIDVKDIARDENLDKTMYIPYLWKDLGYLRGYTKEQLSSMVTKSVEIISDADKVRQDLISAQKAKNQ